MHAAVAQRRTRSAQLWALVLVVGGLGVLFVPTQWIRSAPEAAKAPAPTPLRLGGAQLALADTMPANDLAGILNRVVGPQKSPTPPPPPPPPPDDPNHATPAAPPPKPTLAIRMLSAIIGRGVGPDGEDRRRAIIAIDDRQIVAAPGDIINGKDGAPEMVRLTEVHTDHLMIEKGGVAERLDLTIPVDRPVTILPTGNPANLVNGMGNNPNAPGGVGGRPLAQNLPSVPPTMNIDPRSMTEPRRGKTKAMEPGTEGDEKK